MKTIKTLSLLVLIAFSITMSAQETKKEERKERSRIIEEMKRDFIKERLNLSEEKTVAYIALMEEYDAKKKEIRKAVHVKKEAKTKEKVLTEEEANILLAKKIETKEKMLSLEREHIAKSIEMISAVKVIEYYKAEKEFKKELLKMLEDKRHSRMKH